MPSLAAPLPTIHGLSHIGIACPDLAASLAFYTGLLGYSEHCRLNYLATGKLMLVCLKISDEQWVELFAGEHLPPDAGPLHQVAVQIDDAAACRARLAACGYPVPDRVWQGQMRNFGFTTPDPHGITIEFVHATPESWMVRDAGRFLPAAPIAHRIIAAGIPGQIPPAALDAFYGLALGLTVEHGPDGSWQVPVATNPAAQVTDWILGGPAVAVPWFTLQVDDLAATQARIEAQRHACAWSGSLRIEGNRLVVLDPAGIELHFVTRITDELDALGVRLQD